MTIVLGHQADGTRYLVITSVKRQAKPSVPSILTRIINFWAIATVWLAIASSAAAYGSGTDASIATPSDTRNNSQQIVARYQQLRYGSTSNQTIEVVIPNGPGPHPVAILIRGECSPSDGDMQARFREIGGDLAARGIAVWNIGYRSTHDPGGGYPNTFLDVGIAIDLIRSKARGYALDLDRSVLVGHSSGGHLALWAAARGRILHSSRLHSENPFIPSNVVSLAGVGDVEAFSSSYATGCKEHYGEALVGRPSDARPNVFADTSPSEMMPHAPNTIVVSGILDRVVPPFVAHDFARHARPGVGLTMLNVEGANHLDLISKSSPAWAKIRELISGLVARYPYDDHN